MICPKCNSNRVSVMKTVTKPDVKETHLFCRECRHKGVKREDVR